VTSPASALPDDPGTLKALVAEERAENERLRQIIKAMQRHRFGRRAESLPEDQLLLGLEEAEQVEAAGLEKAETAPAVKAERTTRRRANRGALPSHLPRVETLVDVESTACPCCSGTMHRIGEDVSERLDIVPAQVRVLVIRRPKYACRACEDVVVQAPAPARLIEGGLPTDSTLAQVLVSKYADHLPLYRQAQIYARQGVSLDRSTLADWVGRAAFLLRPVHQRLLDKLKASPKLFADETTAPVLDPGRGRTKTGQLWAYARDDRPWGGTDPPGVAYVYAPDRTAERPVAHLAGFRGILQVDGYEAYKTLARRGEVHLAFCWSHVRRAFYDLAKGLAPIATEALARIAALYRIESAIRGRSAEERRAVRQARSRPVIEALEPWLREKLALISQKSTLAEAIRYALTRWRGSPCSWRTAGSRSTPTGRARHQTFGLDQEECSLRRLGQRAEHWAVVALLIETCKLIGVEPRAYLTDVIARIVNGHPQSRLDDLLPWAYPTTPTPQSRGLRATLTPQSRPDQAL
jgi:transposase